MIKVKINDIAGNIFEGYKISYNDGINDLILRSDLSITNGSNRFYSSYSFINDFTKLTGTRECGIAYTKLLSNGFEGYLDSAVDFGFFDPMSVPAAYTPRENSMNYTYLFPMSKVMGDGKTYYKTFHFLPTIAYSRQHNNVPNTYMFSNSTRVYPFDGGNVIFPEIHVNDYFTNKVTSERISYTDEINKRNLFTVSRTNSMEEAIDQYGFSNILNGSVTIDIRQYDGFTEEYVTYSNNGVSPITYFNFPIGGNDGMTFDNIDFEYNHSADLKLMVPIDGPINADFNSQIQEVISGGLFHEQPVKVSNCWFTDTDSNDSTIYSTSGFQDITYKFPTEILTDNLIENVNTGQEIYNLSRFKCFVIRGKNN